MNIMTVLDKTLLTILSNLTELTHLQKLCGMHSDSKPCIIFYLLVFFIYLAFEKL